VCEAGEAGPWLLVVHGNGGDAAAMRPQVDYFSQHYGATHMIPVEDPKRFNQRMASFFAGAAHGCR
jgi:hypothetical protein